MILDRGQPAASQQAEVSGTAWKPRRARSAKSASWGGPDGRQRRTRGPPLAQTRTRGRRVARKPALTSARRQLETAADSTARSPQPRCRDGDISAALLLSMEAVA